MNNISTTIATVNTGSYQGRFNAPCPPVAKFNISGHFIAYTGIYT